MEFKESKKSGDIIEDELLKIIQQKYPKAESKSYSSGIPSLSR